MIPPLTGLRRGTISHQQTESLPADSQASSNHHPQDHQLPVGTCHAHQQAGHGEGGGARSQHDGAGQLVIQPVRENSQEYGREYKD